MKQVQQSIHNWRVQVLGVYTAEGNDTVPFTFLYLQNFPYKS